MWIRKATSLSKSIWILSNWLIELSCEKQLLVIVFVIYANFDQHSSLEARANFLDISKPLTKNGMRGYYLNLSVLEYQEIF